MQTATEKKVMCKQECHQPQCKCAELQQEVERLKLEIYHLKMPSLKECMAIFNSTDEQCFCAACMMDRSDEQDMGYQEWMQAHDDIWACDFKPKWETYLQKIGATVNAPDENPVQIGRDGEYGDTAACVQTVGRRDWVFAGWGRPLSSLSSPRKRIWDTIIADCSPEEE